MMPWLSEIAPLTDDDLRMLGWQDEIKEEILELYDAKSDSSLSHIDKP